METNCSYVCGFIFIHYLCNKTVGSSHWIGYLWIVAWLMNNELEGYERKRSWSNWRFWPGFAWRNWVKLRRTSIETAGFRTKIWTRDLNTKQKCWTTTWPRRSVYVCCADDLVQSTHVREAVLSTTFCYQTLPSTPKPAIEPCSE